MHEKKTKGDIGLAHAICSLTEQGYSVGVPLSEHLPFDLFAWKDGKIYTVQARYTTPVNGVASVKLRSSWADKNGNHYRTREQGDFDVLAVFVPEHGTCFLKEQELGTNGTAVSIRLEPPKNFQTKGIINFNEHRLL